MVRNPHLKMPKAPAHLHIWDFDDTLFHTVKRDEAQRVWKRKHPHKMFPEVLATQWWGHEGSLSAPFDEVPEGPAFEQCRYELTQVMPLVNDGGGRNEREDTMDEGEDTIVYVSDSALDDGSNLQGGATPTGGLLSVLMTGRHLDLRRHVMRVLDTNGLEWKLFSSLCFKPNQWCLGTIHYKCGAVCDLLRQYPSVKHIALWEDRIGHVRAFYEYLEVPLRNQHIELRVHYVLPVYGKEALTLQRHGDFCDCSIVVVAPCETDTCIA